MAAQTATLSLRSANRIYERGLRPDHLEGVTRSEPPTAVLVGGQPGAGKAFASRLVRAQLAATVGDSVLISPDELREYHPYWQQHGRVDPAAAADVRADVGRWFARLVDDTVQLGAHVIVVTSMRRPDATEALAARLKADGYHVAAVVLATDREQSRQATLARYDLARASGLAGRFVSAAEHDAAYDGLRDTLARLETGHSIDRLQIVARDGRQLYANERRQEPAGDGNGTGWRQDPMAAQVLQDFRERQYTSREEGDSVLRWQILAQRLSVDPSVPRDVASQAVAWRNAALARAGQDPETARLITWGREAVAFETMPRQQFAREFAHHAKAVERLDEAILYAEKTFERQADRERFVAQSRRRIAERIAEGRYVSPGRVREKAPGAKTR